MHACILYISIMVHYTVFIYKWIDNTVYIVPIKDEIKSGRVRIKFQSESSNLNDLKDLFAHIYGALILLVGSN